MKPFATLFLACGVCVAIASMGCKGPQATMPKKYMRLKVEEVAKDSYFYTDAKAVLVDKDQKVWLYKQWWTDSEPQDKNNYVKGYRSKEGNYFLTLHGNFQFTTTDGVRNRDDALPVREVVADEEKLASLSNKDE
jgi:hypothetical protein